MAQMHVNKKFNATLEAGRIQKMLNRQELQAQRAAVARQQPSQQPEGLNAEDSIMIDRTSNRVEIDPLLDQSAFVSIQSRTAAGQRR